MKITLIQSQFTQLKKLMDVISSAISHGNHTGEIANSINRAEWNTSGNEIKIKLA